MGISSKQRFLGICRFERPGDLFLATPYFHDFWASTLEEWVKQGAPERIVDNRFRGAYFQMDHIRMLREIRLGAFMDRTIDVAGASYVYLAPPVVPSYEVRTVSEDNHTVVLINEAGQKVRVSKDNPEKMPM